MRAIASNKYGPPEVLRLVNVDKPVPNEDDVLIEVHASSINKADWIMALGRPFVVRIAGGGFLKPKHTIPGTDVAGIVEMVGKNITRFKPGDRVFGNLSIARRGAYAEYACAPENALALMPAGVTFEQAAATPLAAITALQGLRNKGGIQPGNKVLINGASGGVGTFLVQIAKSFGAEVTAICSTGNVEIARSIGADHVIDYAKEDFSQNGELYDLIIGANGYNSIWTYARSLSKKGVYVMSGGTGGQIVQALLFGRLMSRKEGKKFATLTLKPSKEDLPLIAGLLESRKVVPVIDKQYDLSQIVEAFEYFAEGHARGKVVIRIKRSD